jgi:hypothetical protein
MVSLVVMPVSRGTIEKYQNRCIRLVEHATKQWYARAREVANNANRRKWLECKTRPTAEMSTIEYDETFRTTGSPTEALLDSRVNQILIIFSSGNV